MKWHILLAMGGLFLEPCKGASHTVALWNTVQTKAHRYAYTQVTHTKTVAQRCITGIVIHHHTVRPMPAPFNCLTVMTKPTFQLFSQYSQKLSAFWARGAKLSQSRLSSEKCLPVVSFDTSSKLGQHTGLWPRAKIWNCYLKSIKVTCTVNLHFMILNSKTVYIYTALITNIECNSFCYIWTLKCCWMVKYWLHIICINCI